MATRRLYYDDSFLREFVGEVVSCEPAPAGPKPLWMVVLSQTAFYPTSGGQPHDTGILGGARVVDVRDAGEEIIHLTDQPLVRGAVTGCVDWERRFDHMQQHTGQHLLSAVFQERFALPTVSFHLGAELSTIDLEGPEPPEQVLEEAERAANAIVFEDRLVTIRYGTAEEFDRAGIRKRVDRPGILRALEIEGIDLQPCGGTHVGRTGQIGIILVRRCSKIREDWRVEFVCGERARRAARVDLGLLRGLGEELTCGTADLPGAVESALREREALYKKGRVLAERLARAEARLLVEGAEARSEGLKVVARIVDDEDAEFLGLLATEIARCGNSVALFFSRISGNAFFAQDSGAGCDMNQLLREVLGQVGGKGGGTRDFARGRLTEPAKCDEALRRAVERVRAK